MMSLKTRTPMAEKLALLKSAGFTIESADPYEARERGYVQYDHRERATVYGDETFRPYVDFGIRGGDDADQTSTHERSNFRCLMRDFPGMFVPVSYSNVDSLGAFVHDLSMEAIDAIVYLAEQYPIYDESDLSELEWDEIQESWDAYLWSDSEDEIGEDWQDVAALFTSAEIRDAFYGAMSEADVYPEHDGLDVRWSSVDVTGLIHAALTSLVRATFGSDGPATPPLF